MSKEIGGVDERAAVQSDILCDSAYRNGLIAGFGFGINNDESGYQRSLACYQGQIHEARAALTASAPSHGEQVRQMVPDAFLEASRQADDVLTAIIRNNEPIATLERTYGKDWHEAVGKIRTALILQIAAAPSAGSHKEQGE